MNSNTTPRLPWWEVTNHNQTCVPLASRRLGCGLATALGLAIALSTAHTQTGTLESLGWDATGRAFQLRVSSPSDTRLRVDYSDDLSTWEFLGATEQLDSTIELSDPLAFRFPQRFYRAHPTDEIVGEAKPLGAGSVRSWVRVPGQGAPAAIGVTFSSGALSQLPAGALETVLRLPTASAIEPFDHIGINWMPHGHPPPGIYNRPHFDVHFYLVTPQERDLITSSEKMYVMPAPEHLPEDYELIANSGDARMGSHWWDSQAPEAHGESFDATFIFGFYDGSMIFLEPMVSVDFLNSRPTHVATVKQPAEWEKPGSYPTQCRVEYDASLDEYSVALTELTPR
jgi:hypothetical protein